MPNKLALRALYSRGGFGDERTGVAVPGRPPQPTLSPNQALEAQPGAPPARQRHFSRSDREAIVYAEVYGGSDADLDLAVTLRGPDGTAAFEDSDRRGAQDARTDGGTHRYAVPDPAGRGAPRASTG